jgi:ribonucleoside-triphosphate reductase
MDLARDSLELKRKLLERLTDGNLYPYAKHYLRGIKERTGTYWHNHFATIGLVGLNEALTNFMGQDLATAEGRAFGLRVLDHMRSRLGTYQDQTGHFYNLEATPAEGTSYRLAMLDKKLDLSIFCANEADWRLGAEPYYTNSSQLPVGWSQDVFAVLDHQDEFQAAYTGGTVVHCFAGECIDDWRSVKEFVRTTCSRYRLPYFTVTPTFSICPSHGYMAGEHPQCPRCQSDCEVYSRIVGYLRPVQQWNKGKKAEFAKRASFTIQGASEP